MQLPDPRDRHVVAAAIAGQCDVIVTRNLRHFPAEILSAFGVEARDPDHFLSRQLVRVPEDFCAAVRAVRDRLRKPAYPVDRYLEIFDAQGLRSVVPALETFDTI